jgi:vacuolar-type H+-ATPase subunit I/STV1
LHCDLSLLCRPQSAAQELESLKTQLQLLQARVHIPATSPLNRLSIVSHAAYQSQLSDSQQREHSSAAQLRDLSTENAQLRAALDKAASAAHAPPPASDTLASQNAALRERVSELEEQVGSTQQRLTTQPQTPNKLQVEEKQEHLAETALLVEKMFSEFSTLQGFTRARACAALCRRLRYY